LISLQGARPERHQVRLDEPDPRHNESMKSDSMLQNVMLLLEYLPVHGRHASKHFDQPHFPRPATTPSCSLDIGNWMLVGPRRSEYHDMRLTWGPLACERFLFFPWYTHHSTEHQHTSGQRMVVRCSKGPSITVRLSSPVSTAQLLASHQPSDFSFLVIRPIERV